mgnify:CR=1 FL=1
MATPWTSFESQEAMKAPKNPKPPIPEIKKPEAPEQEKTITVDFTNVAQKARVVVFKKGEMLSNKVMEGENA